MLKYKDIPANYFYISICEISLLVLVYRIQFMGENSFTVLVFNSFNFDIERIKGFTQVKASITKAAT